jgi:drug/metabolite transporter (DMT)-like permease
MLLSAIYFIVAALIIDGRITIVTDFKSWMNILGLGLWATMVSNFTGVKAIRRIGPTLTSILGALQPLTAVVLGVVFLDEHLGVCTVSGIVLILAAVTMIVLHQRKKKH